MLKHAGIPRKDAAERCLWLHSFRHTYSTFMAQQVPNAWHLKEILGHSSVATTERYTHVAAETVPLAVVDLKVLGSPEARDTAAGADPPPNRLHAGPDSGLVSLPGQHADGFGVPKEGPKTRKTALDRGGKSKQINGSAKGI